MSRTTCPQETMVAQAARSNEWPTSLAAHVTGCAVCHQVAETSRWMWTISQAAPEAAAGADASLIWWRAQLTERAVKASRAQAPLDFAYIAFLAVATAGLAIWAALNWDTFGYAGEWLLAAARPETWMIINSLDFLETGFFWSIAGAATLLAVLVALPALLED